MASQRQNIILIIIIYVGLVSCGTFIYVYMCVFHLDFQ